MNFRPSFDDVVPIVRELPGFRTAEEKALARTVAERQAHLDAIAKLDAEAVKAYPRQEKVKAEKLAAEQDAIRALKFAQNEYQQTLAAVAPERWACERDRRAHETALIDGEWPDSTLFEIVVSTKSRAPRKRSLGTKASIATPEPARRSASRPPTQSRSTPGWRPFAFQFATRRRPSE